MEYYIGEIFLVGWNFAPPGFVFCDGRLLSIAENEALFALLGTTYGGDGVQTFAVPDLRGRAPVSPTGQQYPGEAGGGETTTLTLANLPAHTHALAACNTSGGSDPTGAYFGLEGTTIPPEGMYAPTPNATMNPTAVSSTGGGQPFESRAPYLAMNFVIATEGVFPSRG